ncbi:3598_t:CDS:2, partial [Diversispora eburnea]
MSEGSGSGCLRRTTTNYFTIIKQILRKQHTKTTEEIEHMQEIENTTNETNDAKDIQTITEIDNTNRTNNETQLDTSTIEPVLENNLTEGNLDKIMPEFNGKDKMISVIFNDKEQIRNSVTKEKCEIKLWDIPHGIKYSVLKTDLTLQFGEVEHLTLCPIGMWQWTIIIFKEEKNCKRNIRSMDVTARDIISNIKNIDVLTCYILRTRNYRKKPIAILSF